MLRIPLPEPRRSGGRPTREERERRRLAALTAKVAKIDLVVAEQAMLVIEDDSVPAAVKVQAMQTIDRIRERLPLAAPTAAAEVDPTGLADLEKRYSERLGAAEKTIDWLSARLAEREESALAPGEGSDGG